MKIIQVINVRWFNATAWYGLFLGKLLQEAGHDVLILALKNTEPYFKSLEWGLDTRCFDLNTRNPIKFCNLYFDLKKLIFQFKPDIVNCHRGEAFVLWALLQKRLKNFCLIRTRGDQRLPKRNFINILLHKHYCQAIITTNSFMYKHFKDKFKIPTDKLYLIPGGVDTKKFFFQKSARKKIRQGLNFSNKDFVVGLLGRFDKVKGQKELIQAVALLYHKKKIKNIRLLLIGFSSALPEKQIRNWLKEYEIENITRITGRVKNVRDYISSLDLGVISSLWSEAIARAALEIMACHIPLISTSVGVMPDLLPEEAMVPAGNPEELARLIYKAINNSNFYAHLKETAIKTISNLTREDFLQATLDVYVKGVNKG
jgi:glycosyltransferase involved in cell wall biosynthesis